MARLSAPPAVLLAGGAARRMGGGDKGLLALGRGTVVGSAIARLRPQVSALALSANGDPARFEALGLPVLPDEVGPDEMGPAGAGGRPGPLAGVLAAMAWAAALDAPRVLTAAADTPFPPADLAAGLEAAGPGVVLAATPSGRHPVFGLWPVGLAGDLRAALAAGTRRVVEFADAHGAAAALFPDEAAFFNVNTPEDLTRARAIARETAP